MKNKRKWVAIVTTMLCMVPLLAGVLGSGTSAQAASKNTVDVTLHKKKMDEFPSNSVENTGKEMTEFDRYEGLEGITFTAWDISKDFYAALNAVLTGKETDAEYAAKTKQVMENFTLDKQTATQVPGDQTTDADGKATFNNLPAKNSDGTYKVYYFEEHASPGVEIGSYKLILMLPLKNDGKENTDIHLYPKNKVEAENPEKELVDEEGKPLPSRPAGSYDFEVGAKIHYRAAFTMPSQIGDILSNGDPRYSKLDLKDAVDTEGVKFEEIERIVVNGVAIDKNIFLSHATTTYTNLTAPFSGLAGFNISMNLTGANAVTTANYLADFAGKKVEIFYAVSFTESTPVDKDINNEFSVTINHDGGKDEEKKNDPVVPPIITGGKKFYKHEDNEDKDALAGAEFVVIKKINSVDHYLKVENNANSWIAVGANETYADAKKFISDQDGRFSVTGLDYGTYYLREIKAPNGFQLLTNDISFTVSKGSYADDQKLDVVNTPKGGLLPGTGGMGIAAFIVIGLGLMATAMIRYRRVRFEV
ncbi:SpaH/EbpB family LPXTG-anchored major pilin [Enterococcus sp. 22-H-5-01]|uniref:SpaH/EbpB family LPXTG-anchored major pilin n=1 Tax=Enterococcus sp. 22-H-5-01 TaxID=3418555 RepID=UPI003CFF3DDD